MSGDDTRAGDPRDTERRVRDRGAGARHSEGRASAGGDGLPDDRPESLEHADPHARDPHAHAHDHSHGAHDHSHGAHGHSHGAHGHSHDHAHGPGHSHHRDASRRGLVAVLALTSLFMVVEAVGGILANSLALLADAGHMLTDAGAIALSLFALWFSQRPATPEKTYGYLRLEILAALLNGATLFVIAGLIIWEAWQRLGAPEPVQSGLMLGVATAGLAVNVAAALILHRSAGESLNVRGAYLHVLGDLLGSVGAIGAALIIMATGWTAADPLISVFVALLILFSSWKLVRESVDILLEAVPPHIDVGEVMRAIQEIPGVVEVHDLHVWTLTSGFFALSAHAAVADPRDNQRVLAEIRSRMEARFHISHITVQIEQPELYQIRGTDT